MKRLRTLTVAVCAGAALVSACESKSSNSSTKDAPAGTGSLPSGIYALNGLDPALSYDDLKPLNDAVQGAEVVGLGEAMHTSGGFHKAKVRAIRDLIETQGFRAVGIESPWIQALPAGEYVASGTGTAVKAVESLFGVFQSEEMLGLIEWIRQFNVDHPNDKVTFFGFDMQEPTDDAGRLNAFLTAAAPAAASTLSAGIATCTSPTSNGMPGPTTQQDYNTCLTGMTAIDSYLAAHEADLVAASSQQVYELAKVSAVALRASASNVFYGSSNNTKSLDARDAAMATIFVQLRHTLASDKKSLIWAHSGHVMKRNEITTSPFVDKNMGSYLTDTYGSQYRVIFASAYNIEVAPWWTGEGTPQVPDPGSVEAILHGLGHDVVFMDANSAALTPGQTYEVSYFGAVPAQQFDGLIFMQDSPPMTPLGGPPTSLQAADLSFEQCTTAGAMPPGWSQEGQGPGFTVACDQTQHTDGAWSANISAAPGHGAFGEFSQCIAVSIKNGSTVDLNASIKASGVANGYAGLWMSITGVNGQSAGFDNMSGRGIVGTTDWTVANIMIQLPQDAKKICFGALLNGDGTAWIDGLSLSWTAAGVSSHGVKQGDAIIATVLR